MERTQPRPEVAPDPPGEIGAEVVSTVAGSALSLQGVAAELCCCCQHPSTATRCDHCGAARAAGRYRVLKLLGQSNHARTYLAQAPGDEPVVLKELTFSAVPSAQTLEGFEREGRLLERIHHPRVPRYREAFREGEGIHTRLYLVEELVAGTPLSARLGGPRWTEAEAIALGRQVLEILRDLHALEPSVIHRDVKPSNLIVRPDGTAVLIDFGAARDLANGVTHNATLVGTFGYMPFEQLGGTADPSCDAYALGATLIHLLAQKPPWEMMSNGRRIEFEGHLRVSPPMQHWLAKLVAPPAEHFHTAAEALAALPDAEGWPEERVPDGRAGDRPTRDSGLGRRADGALALAAAGLAIALIVVIGQTRVLRLPPQSRLPATEPPYSVVETPKQTYGDLDPAAVRNYLDQRARELDWCVADSAQPPRMVAIAWSLLAGGMASPPTIHDVFREGPVTDCIGRTVQGWTSPFNPSQPVPVRIDVRAGR